MGQVRQHRDRGEVHLIPTRAKLKIVDSLQQY
jgi:hypothetical protein